MAPIRVLQVVTTLDRGGAETMIMNYYRKMNRDEVQFDFLVHRTKIGHYENEVINMGGRIFRAFPIRPWNYSKYRRWLRRFLLSHKGEFSAVHAHINENSGFVLDEAKKANIPVRIAHSHIAQMGIDIKYPFRLYGKNVLKKSSPTHCFACGMEAGYYLFGNRHFQVIPNAVDTDSFVYNAWVREAVKDDLNLHASLVIGNVARFHPVKNQIFLADVFFAYLKNHNRDAQLVLVGVGPEQDKVRTRVKELGIEDKVCFLGVRNDVCRILQAFDIFVCPSKLEGLPLSVIEAQASGLPCLLSDRVSKETAITDLVEFLSLDSSAEEWADKIDSMCRTHIRRDSTEEIIRAGYDINTNAKYLAAIYSGAR